MLVTGFAKKKEGQVFEPHSPPNFPMQTESGDCRCVRWWRPLPRMGVPDPRCPALSKAHAALLTRTNVTDNTPAIHPLELAEIPTPWAYRFLAGMRQAVWWRGPGVFVCC